MLIVKVNKNGNKVEIATEGVIDTETASRLSDALFELDYSNLDLTLDFNKTDYITSAGRAQLPYEFQGASEKEGKRRQGFRFCRA